MCHKVKLLSIALLATGCFFADDKTSKISDGSQSKVEKKVDIKSEEQKSSEWVRSVEERAAKNRSVQLPPQEPKSTIKIEDLYQACFERKLTWPNALRVSGKTAKLLVRAGLALLVAKFGCSAIESKGWVKNAFLKESMHAMVALLLFVALQLPMDKLLQFVQWDPRAQAFANKILESIEAGETLVSDQKLVQEATDDALVTNGRSTKVIPLTQRVPSSEKLALSKKISSAIELSKNCKNNQA